MFPRFVLGLLLLLPSGARADSMTPDPWSGLRFLVGEWRTTSGGGTPGVAVSGEFSFRLDLDGRIAIRRSHSEYAPKVGEKEGIKHSDFTVVFPGQAGLRATYWDDEGHVIQYVVKTEDGRVTFESDASTPGPRFKLVYERTGEKTVAVTFFIAQPGKSYQQYVSGEARRK